MVFVYTLTILTSATLLFIIEPMFARMVLPIMGGSPAVWNTTVVFYQIILLLGYIYAHYVPRWLGLKRQVRLHLVLLLLPLAVLPIRIPAFWAPAPGSNPVPSLLLLLIVSIGLPFFIISTSSPLLQKWFERSGHAQARDPYFLYAASNLGSMLALLAYPLVIEPNLTLKIQSMSWSFVYILFIIFTMICAWFILRAKTVPNNITADETSSSSEVDELNYHRLEDNGFNNRHQSVIELGGKTEANYRLKQSADIEGNPPVVETISPRRKARWVFLALVPSSLMLSVTTYFSAEITPIPLFWVIPLAVYLLTFIFAFSGKPLFRLSVMQRVFPLTLLPLILIMIFQLNQPIWLVVLMHLAGLFVTGMLCHGALAEDRPHPQYLTEFYLWLSVGGAIGGIFNALIAPLIFNSVLEYPLMLAVACLALPGLKRGKTPAILKDFAVPLGMGIVITGAILAIQGFHIVIMCLAAVFCFSFSRRPVRFALGIAVIFLASMFFSVGDERTLYTERNFFGINRVVYNKATHLMKLVHGNTIHGMENTDPQKRNIPLTYYYSTGPIGQFLLANETVSGRWHVAAVGLGAGSLSYYSKPGQQWTYYEIDPAVVQIARNPKYFTFLTDFKPTIVLGDARLSLAKAPDKAFDLIVLDAYSSDSIPVHLITREAVRLYLTKLKKNGVLAFHISNRHLRLEPVLGNLARSERLSGLIQADFNVTPDEKTAGKNPSIWVLLSRTTGELQAVSANRKWRTLKPDPSVRVWTDDYSSILSVLHWR